MTDIRAIADSAGMIINGYAFTPVDNGHVRVLNLNVPTSAAVLNSDGSLLETSMDDMEIGIVQEYYRANKEFLDHA
ncbi:hypothetical protein EMO92_01940 [Bifidobacterium reuteri]|uniref:DUF7723 domain-containing protein n=2 Tax=Bifidobacterium reuteri TaxID=983706 RepID=A0A5J5EA94_9BIFI|nr:MULTISPECIES: hypothetical protein [Bifidobacterium]KAA8826407.1 hypothetical protein EMO92_01940 [Bifidobacterium reuteri]KFI85839.1 putative toxin-antitoxin system, toxin component [Bifidobacterium reuteri DSM 23975]TPF79111.1 hypothetical protein BW09_00375 [Bifidobacterium sp. UTCIF-1]TPF80982.1 hypothetical protein BW08_01655 [Bifidobacterium sp. UTCIF-24]TPF83221.1 hypothetical protein BW12_00625 [Bifidobacterium sp. UTCIF-3]